MTKGMESLNQLYRIGCGPSSSHTMGPEKACLFMKELYPEANKYKVILFGSLALTGKGHGTDLSFTAFRRNQPSDTFLGF